MPSSYVDSVPPIIKVLVGRGYSSILDIGPGWGKYGLMCREYLSPSELHAVEAFWSPQMSPVQEAIYDSITYTDVTTFDGWDRCRPTLTLLIDVIEHMSMEHGHAVVRKALEYGDLLVSTPKRFVHQHDEENTYEEHLSFWGWKTLRRYRIIEDVSTIDSLIYLLGPLEEKP